MRKMANEMREVGRKHAGLMRKGNATQGGVSGRTRTPRIERGGY